MKRSVLLTFFLLALSAFSHASISPHIVFNDTTKILFVGNSLTYTNDLPALVVTEAATKNHPVQTETLAFPNYALEDHWNDGQLQEMIKAGKFDFVVVQQGPSSQEEGRGMLLDYGKRIAKLCEKHHTRLAFFMVWPAYANLNNFDGVIKNYTEAATITNSILCPVGKVWKEYMTSNNDLSYYGPDRFHPSSAGSQIAAEIIVSSLFK